jgi:hypothetical protein
MLVIDRVVEEVGEKIADFASRVVPALSQA